MLLLKLNHNPLEISQKGIVYAVLAGLCVGSAEIASFFLFSKGVTVSTGTAIIIGGSVIFTTLLGMIFLKEQLTPLHFLAIILVVIGVILLLK